MTEAAERLDHVRGAIDAAAQRAGRAAQEISLVAVSKTQDAAAIAPLIAAGQLVFGENRVRCI
jgi:PLP dependent protein